MPLNAVMNAVSTVTGSVEKAVIRLRDMRHFTEDQLKESKGATFSNSAMASLSNDLTVLKTAGTGLLGAAASAAKNLMGMTSQAPKEYNRAIQVQFNPSSLKLSGHAGDDDVQITNFTQDGRGVSRGAANLQMDFSVNLIFDQISNTAAFQQDMLTLSSSRLISSIGNNALNAIGNLLGGKPQSVQVTVEAFVAALRNDKTRMICFEWGELCYEGMLRQVNTTYTMFDVTGNPVRAEVGLVIYLMESSSQGIADYTNRYWYTAYYNAYIKGNPLAESMLKLTKLPTK